MPRTHRENGGDCCASPPQGLRRPPIRCYDCRPSYRNDGARTYGQWNWSSRCRGTARRKTKKTHHEKLRTGRAQLRSVSFQPDSQPETQCAKCNEGHPLESLKPHEFRKAVPITHAMGGRNERAFGEKPHRVAVEETVLQR